MIKKKVQPILASLYQKKAKKILIKSQAQFQTKLRKFKLRQSDGFLSKNICNEHFTRYLIDDG